MDKTIKVALISGIVSLIVSFVTTRTQIYISKRKCKKDEFSNLISNNKEIFLSLLKLSRNKSINYYQLRKGLENSVDIFLLLPKKIIKLFEKLIKLLELNGDELKSNEREIKKLSSKIIKKVRKVGIDVSELNK